MLVVGIDSGKTGGIVALDELAGPVLWQAADHPDDGYLVGRDYSPRRMALVVASITRDHEVALCVIEKQQARPKQGRSSILTTGRGWGLWLGVVAASGIPYREPIATTWQRVFGTVPRDRADRKAAIIRGVEARVPALPLTWGRRRKPHDGLADACGMALWGLEQVTL